MYVYVDLKVYSYQCRVRFKLPLSYFLHSYGVSSRILDVSDQLAEDSNIHLLKHLNLSLGEYINIKHKTAIKNAMYLSFYQTVRRLQQDQR